MRRTLLLALVCAAAFAGPADAAVVNVDCARHDLQAKIDAAALGDVLRVKGVCVGSFTIAKTLTVEGNPSATLDGGDLERTLAVNGANVLLRDLEVTGGYVSGTSAVGAGILHGPGTLTLRRVEVSDNLAVATASLLGVVVGAGIASEGGTLRLFDSAVVRNEGRAVTPGIASAFGGGIRRRGSIELVRTVVASNRLSARSTDGEATAGGAGLHITEGTSLIQSSRFANNRVLADGADVDRAAGGGVAFEDVTGLEVVETTLEGNRATAIATSGSVTASGGGIHGLTGDLSIRRSVLTGNAAVSRSTGSFQANGYGGSINTFDGALTIVASRLNNSLARAETGGNAEVEGGAVRHVAGSAFNLRASRFAGNRAVFEGSSPSGGARGGGLAVSSSTALVERTTFHANQALAAPGGAAFGGGLIVAEAITIRSSTVSGNLASAPAAGGGGIAIEGETTILNSTFSGNRARGATAIGGGILADDDLATTHVTLARNRARLGGGLYRQSGPTRLQATLVGLNRGTDGSPDCSGSVISLGRNLIAKPAGCTVTPNATDRTGVAPKLGPLASNGGPTQTILLLAGSPALNWIPAAECAVARDQRGVARPQGRKCDIGATERRSGRRP